MAIKAVIFDLDGTLTVPYLDFDSIRGEMGLTKEDGPIWEAMEKMDESDRREAEKLLHLYEQRAVVESSLNPGAKETLESLGRMGIGVGILTRNTKENALAVGEKHGLKFDAVIGREDGPVKPDAFGVLELCRYFGLEPYETLLVGDYLFDLLCAKAAGAVAVLLANHARAEEFSEYADFTIDKLGEILHIIREKQ